jgi:hypothetical protein
MNTNHTVILGSTAISVSTAIQPNRHPARDSRFLMELNRRQIRLSTTSTSSTARTACETSHRPNGSWQAIHSRRNFKHRFNRRIVATHQATVVARRSSTVVFVGSAVGLLSPPHHVNTRSTRVSAGLLPLPTSAHPLDRCPPLSQALHMSSRHLGDLVEDGRLPCSCTRPLRRMVSLRTSLPFSL